jgi:DNA-directed RNA polymerase subunit RPC12/RpoP
MAAEIEVSLWSRTCGLSTLAAKLEMRVSSYTNMIPQLVLCPHCKKPFGGELLAEGSRHEGFKCPHCRLFVPVERASGASDEPS